MKYGPLRPRLEFIYQDPFPTSVVFRPGDVLTFRVITRSRFRGGQIYVWNPYDANVQPSFFNKSARDDDADISIFSVPLLPWMTSGFNLKLVQPNAGNHQQLWEPNSSNRVWCPCDGTSLWLKSGQCDVRPQPLTLTPANVDVMYSATLATPPVMVLNDLAEGSSFPVVCSSTRPYRGSALFKVASYTAQIYAGAGYAIVSQNGIESAPIVRPFPADPTVPDSLSRCVLGASAWLSAFPAIGRVPLSIAPRSSSSFTAGVSATVALGNGPTYQTVKAALQPDGTWKTDLDLPVNTTVAMQLVPGTGTEPAPYDWIDRRRFVSISPTTTMLYTTEGVYGICSKGMTKFAEPADRPSLMRAAYGDAIGNAGIFAAREMPHGAVAVGGNIYFTVHAPHAVVVGLILIATSVAGALSRTEIPMTLTNDTFYWWCTVAASQAPAGTQYRFLLNDDVEVLDPAARTVKDNGQLKATFGDSPSDSSTSWSIILDVPAVRAASHAHAWQSLGWEKFLIYEIHARRFTNLAERTLTPFDLLTDELQPGSRLGQAGYLRQLPVTVLDLMPVNEFSSAVSWGYDPSFYFGIDEFYGGAETMATFVNAAHANGRGVMVDVVYNHSFGSSLMSIAPDVYRNGDYDGDRMNCGHPMVGEFLRQAVLYMFNVFNVDGFRFDDTKTIITDCQNGWEFLGMIRSSLRAAADAEGRPWPYCVAENSGPIAWNISDPRWGPMDGEWGIDEVYRIRDVSYDSWNPGWDDSTRLKTEMDNPSRWGRPFFQATRFGELHDIVSAQDSGNKRIAARPPFGQGYRMAKALGALTLLSNGIPMLFMGQEVGETKAFSFDDTDPWVNPQRHDLPPATATDNTRILAWFRQIMGLRNDPAKGLRGDANYQVTATGNRTIAFTCGANQSIFAVITFATPDQQQDSSWLGLPAGIVFKEIFNSSWPAFQVEFEQEQTNGGHTARIYSGQILNLPYIGAVVLEKA